ncbi:FAD-dependent monooxygenase [Nocardia sp. NPDC046473]|uniref:FAD-dependent oxidoreductase n=1 Tax=Nocardia sp. NPDC046473 TaxID=3155733 RepID=UPI0033DCF9E3
MVQGRAIVLGASIGGLLAARVLSEHYDQVIVVERDDLSQPGDRRGVPQGKHVHALLARGEEIFEQLFPGLSRDLHAAGAVECEALSEMRMALDGRTLKQSSAGFSVLQASRPFLEWAVRERVRALPNVTLWDRCTAVGLRVDGARVRGVQVSPPSGGVEDLDAELVVSALGRGGPIGKWLDQLGYPQPAEEGVAIDMVYASAFVQLPEGSVGGDKEIIIGMTTGTRAMALFAVEGGRHILTLIGYGGDNPPKVLEEYLDFAATVAPPDVYKALIAGEVLSDISTYRYKANLRRRYERLARFPEGLLVFGDAVCSFSPAYGQGMTMSALQAVALQQCLRDGDDNLPKRFFRAASTTVDDAWMLTQLADSSLPHLRTQQRPLLQRITAPLIPVALVAAERDRVVAQQISRIAGLLDPPRSIFRPTVIARAVVATAVAFTGLPRRRGDTDHEQLPVPFSIPEIHARWSARTGR